MHSVKSVSMTDYFDAASILGWTIERLAQLSSGGVEYVRTKEGLLIDEKSLNYRIEKMK